MRIQLIALLPIIALAGAESIRRPVPRTYDTHAYYALELHSGLGHADATALAEALGAELVEPIGELQGHWLVRAPHETLVERSGAVPTHSVLRRWSELPGHPHHRSLTHLPLRKRAKRQMPSAHDRRPHTTYAARSRRQLAGLPLADDTEEDKTELLFAQGELGFADPILHQQWHLINTRQTDFELNVTGLWANGITGEGVKVAIIDDGLDLNSDDLAENFVSEDQFRGVQEWRDPERTGPFS